MQQLNTGQGMRVLTSDDLPRTILAINVGPRWQGLEDLNITDSQREASRMWLSQPKGLKLHTKGFHFCPSTITPGWISCFLFLNFSVEERHPPLIYCYGLMGNMFNLDNVVLFLWAVISCLAINFILWPATLAEVPVCLQVHFCFIQCA